MKISALVPKMMMVILLAQVVACQEKQGARDKDDESVAKADDGEVNAASLSALGKVVIRTYPRWNIPSDRGVLKYGPITIKNHRTINAASFEELVITPARIASEDGSFAVKMDAPVTKDSATGKCVMMEPGSMEHIDNCDLQNFNVSVAMVRSGVFSMRKDPVFAFESVSKPGYFLASYVENQIETIRLIKVEKLADGRPNNDKALFLLPMGSPAFRKDQTITRVLPVFSLKADKKKLVTGDRTGINGSALGTILRVGPYAQPYTELMGLLKGAPAPYAAEDVHIDYTPTQPGFVMTPPGDGTAPTQPSPAPAAK